MGMAQPEVLVSRVGVSLNTRAAAFVVDGDQRIVGWSAGSASLLGYGVGEVLGKYCYEVLAGVEEGGRRVCTRNCPAFYPFGGNGSADLILRVRPREPVCRWLAITHLEVAFNGDEAGVLHILHDVTVAQKAKLLVSRIHAQLERVPAAAVAPLSTVREVPFGLTQRELQVLSLLSEGTKTEEIAEKLVLSVFTVRNHIRSILGKLRVQTRLGALAVARRWNLV